jgi:orotidine-5'-phosphate decarboxylase
MNTATTHFADTLVQRVRHLGHPLCVGLDPYLDRIPAVFGGGDLRPAGPDTVRAVGSFLTAVLDVIAPHVAIVKPQAALFEQLGWPGMELLAATVAAARQRGLLVLLDAKRGDIGDTAAGYARAYLSADAPLPVDAMTVNPYMGADAVEPFVRAAETTGRGVVVLVRNSNPGAAVVQKHKGADGRQLFEVVADALLPFESRLMGVETGWSSLMVTAGATSPDDTDAIRTRLRRSLFLTLGYGTQGGSVEAALRGFVPGPAGLEGGVVNCSRSVLYGTGDGETDAPTWERALTRRVATACNELRRAVSAGNQT